jgi:protein ImuB
MLLCVDAGAQPDLRDGWQDVLDAFDAVTPLVDDALPGLAFLEMHGIAGDASRWMSQTRNVLASFGCTARLGVGINKIAALGAAYAGDGTVCSRGDERALLAPLPLTVLQLEPEIVERLTLLGIDSLGDLAELPHGPFVRRFGKASSRWHELARGIDHRPFLPRVRVVAIEAAILGEGRVADEAQVFFALRMLLTRICGDLSCCGKRAGALHLALELDDASACAYDVPLSTPTADERTIFDMLRAKLEGATFHAPIVGLKLQARQLEEGGEEQALFDGDDVDPQRVAVAIARLEAMLGERVGRAQTREAHVLEERFTYEPFITARHPEPFDSLRSLRINSSRRTKGTLTPQLRLLEVREIEVVMCGGEPMRVDYKAVVRCAGPWRISERPFTDAPVTRDEYDVALDDGSFARIYRQGSRWYLRGVYE